MMNPYIQTNNGTVRARGLKRRGKNQHNRVGNGIQNGSIDSTELANLKEMRQSAFSELSEAKASGGTVNFQERVSLHQDLNQLSRTIYQYKHN
jgi:hypothetical protein